METAEKRTDEGPCDPVRISGWGRYPVVETCELRSERLASIAPRAILSRGLGRSYGDASLPPVGRRPVASSLLADRILGFDPASGVLRAEAGLSLRRMNELFLPRRRFTPVTPGTQFVTVGGMVAADVHGKNHHVAGCFGEHVRALRMRVADGRELEVDDEHHPELFHATLGGMGLTGHILEVEVALDRLPSPWIWARCEPVLGLESLVEGLRRASADWPLTVAWVDCFARGGLPRRAVLMAGRWATAAEAPRRYRDRSGSVSVPFVPPEWLLNPILVRAFNRVYYLAKGRRSDGGVVHPLPFFYPLDAVRHWNRLYGRRGFTQYQCVLPAAAGTGAVIRFFETFAAQRGVCYLCVIKDCGPAGKGTLSFPLRGTSIALDIPMRGERTQRLVDALNECVIAEGGRVYLAKDALTRGEHFRAMEPRLDEFQRVRAMWDPRGALRSSLSVRLFGDPS